MRKEHALETEDRKRLLEATEFAYTWHAEQKRKQSEIPYVSHLLQVAGLVLEHGGSVDQAIAGLLHDSLEDAPDAQQREEREQAIAECFGEGVLDMVRDCTDTGPDESLEQKRPWAERKTNFVARLAHARPDSLLVVACDKRHNLQAIVGDVRSEGASVFERFTGRPGQQVWYFEAVFRVLRDSIPIRLSQELDALLEALKSQVADVDD